MKFKTLLAGGLVAIATALPYAAQSALDPDINDKIRKEEAANSQVMRTLHYLADVYGPRVTGSPNHKAAAEWAVKTMTGWGMQNGHLEPWDWNHPGWANEHLAVHAVSPFKDALVVEALAWTPGTKGTVKAKAFNLVVPDGPLADPTADPSAAGRGGRGPARLNPTEAELSAFLNSPAIKEQIKGAAVLVGKPIFVMRNEDYGRIARILADGTPVELEATIVNKTYPSGPSYNTVAEIAGTDKAAEVVMAGGHLDSWQSATGATDNAIGCAIMMEAARILKAIGVQPRRTIRIALWSGEEEGLLGSLAYVKQHFGTAEAPKPEFATFNGYLNIDTGTGRLRGASVFGPPEGAKRLASMLAPFKDLKIGGATASSSRATGGTDSTSDRKSTRLNSSHTVISYAVFCLKKKKVTYHILPARPQPIYQQ